MPSRKLELPAFLIKKHENIEEKDALPGIQKKSLLYTTHRTHSKNTHCTVSKINIIWNTFERWGRGLIYSEQPMSKYATNRSPSY